MKMRVRTRLAVEMLEDRSVPAVTASVTNGSLVIVGDPEAASNVVLTASDTEGDKVADTFTVVDADTTVGTFEGVSGDVVLRLSSNDDVVSIDLAGLSAPGDIYASLGNGSNALDIGNGTVAGSVRVRGGRDGNTVNLNGNVEGDVAFRSARFDNTAGNTLNLLGDVAGSVTFFGTNLADTLSVTGNIGGSLFAKLGAGDDTATVDGTVAGSLVLRGCAGEDSLTVSSTVGDDAAVSDGTGEDSAEATDTARCTEGATADLGEGGESLSPDDSAALPTLADDGVLGPGFRLGNRFRPGLRPPLGGEE